MGRVIATKNTSNNKATMRRFPFFGSGKGHEAPHDQYKLVDDDADDDSVVVVDQTNMTNNTNTTKATKAPLKDDGNDLEEWTAWMRSITHSVSEPKDLPDEIDALLWAKLDYNRWVVVSNHHFKKNGLHIFLLCYVIFFIMVAICACSFDNGGEYSWPFVLHLYVSTAGPLAALWAGIHLSRNTKNDDVILSDIQEMVATTLVGPFGDAGFDITFVKCSNSIANLFHHRVGKFVITRKHNSNGIECQDKNMSGDEENKNEAAFQQPSPHFILNGPGREDLVPLISFYIPTTTTNHRESSSEDDNSDEEEGSEAHNEVTPSVLEKEIVWAIKYIIQKNMKLNPLVILIALFPGFFDPILKLFFSPEVVSTLSTVIVLTIVFYALGIQWPKIAKMAQPEVEVGLSKLLEARHQCKIDYTVSKGDGCLGRWFKTHSVRVVPSVVKE
mmetsp:Transcript_4487/g.12901  ORF Transcript_4487/g.12901 Transcript_4487/m.12901 type:complete len:443 (-) Transcript_4487:125-1453(-)